MLQWLIWIRAYVLWTLMVGQAALAASHFTGWGWKAISAGPDAFGNIIMLFALSGLAGCIGELFWHACTDHRAARAALNADSI